PYEIYPSYYETYKWGLYNELVVLDLIDALRLEGFPDQAAWLQRQWETKTKYFVYDDPYPFRSEYAFDRTDFESTYAFAKYYASYLSSWALMNTGRADTNYGFWYPGQENDGAAGWQFTSTKVGSAWMGSSYPGGVTEPRGPWHYDGEIDLGFGGALRMAATIVTRDPIFGW